MQQSRHLHNDVQTRIHNVLSAILCLSPCISLWLFADETSYIICLVAATPRVCGVRVCVCGVRVCVCVCVCVCACVCSWKSIWVSAVECSTAWCCICCVASSAQKRKSYTTLWCVLLSALSYLLLMRSRSLSLCLSVYKLWWCWFTITLVSLGFWL